MILSGRNISQSPYVPANISSVFTKTYSKVSFCMSDSKQGDVTDMAARLEKKHIHVSDLINDNKDEFLVNDPIHQVQDVQKATAILEEYLADTRYRDSALMRTLSDVQSRADNIDDLVNDLRMEMKVSFKSGNIAGGAGRLREEMKGLHSLMQMHSDEQREIEELKEQLIQAANRSESYGVGPAAYEQLVSTNAELEAEVAAANMTANLTIGIFGIVVLIVGVLLWFKMRAYEKKHFL